MHLKYAPFELKFRHAFGVSSNTRSATTTVFVKVASGEWSGYGEACLPPYLSEDLAGTLAYLEKAQQAIEESRDEAHEDLLKLAEGIELSSNAGRAAVTMAITDMMAARSGLPLSEFLGLEFPQPADTMYTVAIGPESQLEYKLAAASDFSLLKIKAGTADDRKLIRMIRRHTYKPLVVDVNQGWRDRHQALDMIGWMKDHGVVMVEQPMPASREEDMRWLFTKSPLPLFADESLTTVEGFAKVEGCFHGINIKLMKCGGLQKALQLADHAKRSGLAIMLGCMAESSCAVTAMAHLSGLATYIDLDAPLLYTNDPFAGATYVKGRITVPRTPGSGARPVRPLFAE